VLTRILFLHNNDNFFKIKSLIIFIFFFIEFSLFAEGPLPIIGVDSIQFSVAYLNNSESSFTDNYFISTVYQREEENYLKDQKWDKSIGGLAGSTYYTSTSSQNSNFPIGAAMGIGILSGAIVLISNDFYLYPSYSFFKSYYEDRNYSKGIGWVFGFRKTFMHSAIEYGMSSTAFYTKGIRSRRMTGYHINYVQQFLYDKTPSYLKLYAGPTINMVEGFGFGGIAGTEFRLSEGIKFDIRYEYSTQTNQIQAGLIFTFQKESWLKKH
jgi:hypothetical protein